MEAYKRQIKHFVDIKVAGSNNIEAIYAKYMPEVFLSVITNDCITNGKDYNAGGARYNTSYLQGVGIGTVADSLAAIKYHVYEKKDIPMDALLKALADDFKDNEGLRQTLLNKSPKYGNDDDYADGLMREVFKCYHDCVTGRPNVRGGTYRVNMLPTTCHVYFGEVMTASANGRKAGKPVSEGISPTQGADTNGPTAVVRSASKMDHLRTGGTLLNQKFTPKTVEGQTGLDAMGDLIRTYFAMDGHHIQFNVINRETLVKAQQNPEEYKDLIVRVAGYSDHFRNLSKALQDEIIERTEQEL
jgi:formate C-acetyltransferase